MIDTDSSHGVTITGEVEGVPTTVASELSIGYRESLITTFVECLTSSCSRPTVTSQPSR
jgi:hypothetical protein